MNEKVKRIIRDVLMEKGWNQNNIIYVSYKYEQFEDCVAESDYNTICENRNLHFDSEEREILFEILERLGWRASQFTDYHFIEIR